MFSLHKFCMIVLFAFALACLSLSACAPAVTAQPTALPNSTATDTLLPTETIEPDPTATVVLATETPEDLSNITDAMLEHDRAEALKAATAPIASLPNASQEEIVKALLDKWLAYYTKDEVNAYARLKDYKIEQVTIIGDCPQPKNTIKFVADVLVSVQTHTLHSGDWEANPNGTEGDDHWIYHLTYYVSITGIDGNYILKGEGVPPCSS